MNGMKAYLSHSLREENGNTISSIVYKILVSITESQTISYIEEKDLLVDNQGACIP